MQSGLNTFSHTNSFHFRDRNQVPTTKTPYAFSSPPRHHSSISNCIMRGSVQALSVAAKLVFLDFIPRLLWVIAALLIVIAQYAFCLMILLIVYALELCLPVCQPAPQKRNDGASQKPNLHVVSTKGEGRPFVRCGPAPAFARKQCSQPVAGSKRAENGTALKREVESASACDASSSRRGDEVAPVGKPKDNVAGHTAKSKADETETSSTRGMTNAKQPDSTCSASVAEQRDTAVEAVRCTTGEETTSNPLSLALRAKRDAFLQQSSGSDQHDSSERIPFFTLKVVVPPLPLCGGNSPSKGGTTASKHIDRRDSCETPSLNVSKVAVGKKRAAEWPAQDCFFIAKRFRPNSPSRGCAYLLLTPYELEGPLVPHVPVASKSAVASNSARAMPSSKEKAYRRICLYMKVRRTRVPQWKRKGERFAPTCSTLEFPRPCPSNTMCTEVEVDPASIDASGNCVSWGQGPASIKQAKLTGCPTTLHLHDAMEIESMDEMQVDFITSVSPDNPSTGQQGSIQWRPMANTEPCTARDVVVSSFCKQDHRNDPVSVLESTCPRAGSPHSGSNLQGGGTAFWNNGLVAAGFVGGSNQVAEPARPDDRSGMQPAKKVRHFEAHHEETPPEQCLRANIDAALQKGEGLRSSPLDVLYFNGVNKLGPPASRGRKVLHSFPREAIKGFMVIGLNDIEMLVERASITQVRSRAEALGMRPLAQSDPLTFVSSGGQPLSNDDPFLAVCVGDTLARWRRAAKKNRNPAAREWYGYHAKLLREKYPQFAEM